MDPTRILKCYDRREKKEHKINNIIYLKLYVKNTIEFINIHPYIILKQEIYTYYKYYGLSGE